MQPVTPSLISSATSRLTPAAPAAAQAGHDGLNLLIPALPQVMAELSTPAVADAPAEPEAAAEQLADPAALLALLIDPATPPAPERIIAVPAMAAQVAGELSRPGELLLPTERAATMPAPLLTPVITPGGTLARETTDNAAQPLTPVAGHHASSAMLKLSNHADALFVSQQVLKEMRAQRDDGITLPVNPVAASATALSPALLAHDIMAAQRAPVIHLPAAPGQQAQALQQALGERLQMQIDQRTQKATIRLDPPHLGKMDIALHFEAGKLQVQIQAAQPEVYRALQQASAELRASLSEHNNVQVNVQVSTHSGDSRQQQRHRDEVHANISHNPEEVADDERRTDRSILTTV
ncbi:flagellar hook-length control protein FliK [Pantoea sp. B65]|uniref:flagellar hook-length control protein FliK n=1 Tax=Pantoea sp. B65 TaxID=2813359 RepID=UPI0039B642A4